MPTPTIAPVTTAEPSELSALIDIMKQAITMLNNWSKPSAPHNPHSHFCGVDHFKNSCKVLQQYICNRKCMLHNDGHSGLSDGCSILGNISGRWIKDCLNKWNHQNPTPALTDSLLFSMLPKLCVATFQLSSEQHIWVIEEELFALYTHEQVEAAHTPAQEAGNLLQWTVCLFPCPLMYIPGLATASIAAPIFIFATTTTSVSTPTSHIRTFLDDFPSDSLVDTQGG